MAATIMTAIVTTNLRIASAEEIRAAFIENNQALTWLAEFLIGDETIASACVIDDYAQSRNGFGVLAPQESRRGCIRSSDHSVRLIFSTRKRLQSAAQAR